MQTKTYYRCSKCGATIEASEADAAGWLVDSNAHHAGWMVIRCPKHITEYAKRQTRLTQAEEEAIEDSTRETDDAYYRA